MVPKYNFTAVPRRLSVNESEAYVVQFRLKFGEERIQVPMVWTVRDIRLQFPWWMRWLLPSFVAECISNLFCGMLENVGDCINDIGCELRGEPPYDQKEA